MANHTVVSTATQETLLTGLVSAYNAAQNASLTNEQYVQSRFDALMNEVAVKDRDRRWDALTATDKDAALATVE